jgi:hypothetical protein
MPLESDKDRGAVLCSIAQFSLLSLFVNKTANILLSCFPTRVHLQLEK